MTADTLDQEFAHAMQRAAAKLQAVRAQPPEPAGRFWGAVVIISIFLLLPGLALTAAGVKFGVDALDGDDQAVVATIMCLLIGLPFLIAGIVKIAGTRADTPKRALLLFYRLLAKGKFKAANRLVIPEDFDGYARYYPEIRNFGGQPPADPLFFDEPAGFGDYWNSLLRWHTSPYCLVRIRKLRIREVTPDVLICDYRLQLEANTSLWILLIFVALILALIVDIATRKRLAVDQRKILIRAGDEWLLFNGAWEEPEEEELDWLG